MNIALRSERSAIYPAHFTGYALGLLTADYNGRQIYYHTGGADGFVTNTCFVPEEKLGIAIFTNNDNQYFFEALRYQVLDAYLGVPYADRSKRLLRGFMQELNETVSTTQALQARVKGDKPMLPIEAYTGSYVNELYGPVTIDKDKEGKGLVIDFKGHNNLKATVQYMDNGEWLLTYNHLGYGIFPVKFKMAGNKVISIETRVNEFIDYDPYTFTKKP
jgi:hypothetical protein